MFVSKLPRMALRIVLLNLTNDWVETRDALRDAVAELPVSVRGLASERVQNVLGRFTVDGESYSLEVSSLETTSSKRKRQ